jgi:hypothetical protein
LRIPQEKKTMNDVHKNDPGPPPDHTTHDPLARMLAHISSYIARRRDGLADPLDPDDPDGLAHQANQIASHLRQFFDLQRTRATSSPEYLESEDRFRREGGLDAHLDFADTETTYQSVFYPPRMIANDILGGKQI